MIYVYIGTNGKANKMRTQAELRRFVAMVAEINAETMIYVASPNGMVYNSARDYRDELILERESIRRENERQRNRDEQRRIGSV